MIISDTENETLIFIVNAALHYAGKLLKVHFNNMSRSFLVLIQLFWVDLSWQLFFSFTFYVFQSNKRNVIVLWMFMTMIITSGITMKKLMHKNMNLGIINRWLSSRKVFLGIKFSYKNNISKLWNSLMLCINGQRSSSLKIVSR